MAYRHVSLIDLYLHTKFHRNRKNFLWTDGHLRPTLLGRSRPNNNNNSHHVFNSLSNARVWHVIYIQMPVEYIIK